MKTAVITGAVSGIGKSLAAACIAAGYEVFVLDIDEQPIPETAIEQNQPITFFKVDLQNPGQIHHAVDFLMQTGEIDLLIHNAGISEVGQFQHTQLAQLDAVIAVNLTAPLLLTAELLACDLLAEHASVVFISSLSHYVGYPGASVYAATKDGLVSYARTLRVAYPGLHVLTVFPGPTRTAHARRYSPDNTHEARRMSPDVLAQKIMLAVHHKKQQLIPGIGLSLMALVGKCFPSLMDTVMKRTLLDKFPMQKSGE